MAVGAGFHPSAVFSVNGFKGFGFIHPKLVPNDPTSSVCYVLSECVNHPPTKSNTKKTDKNLSNFEFQLV